MKNFFKLIPMALKWIPLVWTSVHTIEQFAKDIKGDDKKRAAIQLFATLLAVSESGLETDLVDNNKFLEAVGKLMDAYVGLMNIITDIQAKQKDKD